MIRKHTITFNCVVCGKEFLKNTTPRTNPLKPGVFQANAVVCSKECRIIHYERRLKRNAEKQRLKKRKEAEQ